MFYQDKTVVVTGGSGFVGTHFVRELLRRGAKVRVPVHKRPMVVENGEIELIPVDLTIQEDCLRAFDGADFVFHAAGAVSAAGMTVANPMSAITANLILTARALEAAWEQGVERILIFSSGTTAYPDADTPVKEDQMWNGPPPQVYFGYGWMRRYLELLGEFVSSKSGMQIALCRPTAVYGRHDDFHTKTSHVIPALIRRAVDRANPFVVWGTGDEIRDFLHVTDLVNGCLLLLEKHAVCDPVNIGYGRAVRIRDVVESILKATGYEDAHVIFDASKPTTIPVRMVDTSKATELLGFSPAVSIDEGLRDTVAWYQETRKRE